MSFLKKLSVKREPVIYLGLAVGVAYLFLQVQSGVAVNEVLGDNAGELLVGALVTLLTRASVFSPDTVERSHQDHATAVHLSDDLG
jgi:hypothetical protein